MLGRQCEYRPTIATYAPLLDGEDRTRYPSPGRAGLRIRRKGGVGQRQVAATKAVVSVWRGRAIACRP